MKMLAFLTATFSCLFLAVVPSIGAENPSQRVSSLLQDAQRFYAQGKIDKAASDFGRALLLDTDIKEVRDVLLQTVSHSKEAVVVQKFHMMFLEDLLHQIGNLTGKIQYFEDKRKSLIQKLVEEGFDEDLIEERIGRIENKNFGFQEGYQKGYLLDHGEGHQREGDLLRLVNNALKSEAEKLSDRLDSLQEQLDLLRRLSKQGSSAVSAPWISVKSSGLVATLEGDRSPALEAETVSSSDSDIPYREDIRLLKEELADVHKQLDELRRQVQEKNKKMDDLTRQIVDLSLKLSEKEALLTEKIDKLTGLNDEVADLRSRLDLGRRIIQEKNSQMELVQNSFQKAVLLKEKEVHELSGILEIYKGELSDARKSLKNKVKDISSLEGKLDSLKTQIFEKDKILQETKKDLAVLRSQLISVQKKILELKRQPHPDRFDNSGIKDEILDLESRLENVRHFLFKKLDDFEKISIFPNGQFPNEP